MEKFTNQSYEKIRTLSRPCVSPSGTYAVYTVQTMNLQKDRFETSLWAADLKEQREFRLTAGPSDRCALWLDGETALFVRPGENPEKETVFWKISVKGGEAVPYMTVPVSGALAVRAGADRYLILGMADRNEAEEAQTGNWLYYTEYPFHVEGQGYASRQRLTIWLWEAEKKKLTPLLEPLMNVWTPYFGEPVLAAEQGFWFCGDSWDRNRQGNCGIYFYSWTERQARLLCSGPWYVYSFSRSGGTVRAEVWISRGAETGTMSLVSAPETGGEWKEMPDEGSLQGIQGDLFIRAERARPQLFRLLPDGEEQRIPTGDVFPEAVAESAYGLLLLGWKKNRLCELYFCRDGSCLPLSHQNDGLFASCSFSEPCLLQTGGIEGWVMRPVGAEPGKTCPAILNIHGGPHGYFCARFLQEHQRWANEGYYVLFCNPRGSVSYGRRFADINGKMGVDDYEDLMAFVDAALAEYPDIDPGRLAVTGQSYGGYMTNWVIGHTDRFAAAVPRMSISNWISMRGTSDERWYADSVTGADPWEDLDRVWFHSPLRYVRSVHTPTLFIQHEKDNACPPEQAEQMFAALLEQDVPTRLMLNLGVGHGGRKVSQLLHDIDVMLAWFADYLKAPDGGET